MRRAAGAPAPVRRRHPKQDVYKRQLINRALLYLYHKGEYAPERGWTPRLCHRLDTGTSGLDVYKRQGIKCVLSVPPVSLPLPI